MGKVRSDEYWEEPRRREGEPRREGEVYSEKVRRREGEPRREGEVYGERVTRREGEPRREREVYPERATRREREPGYRPDEYEEGYERPQRHRRPPPRRRSAWPLLLGGCAGGVVLVVLVAAVVVVLALRNATGGAPILGPGTQTFQQIGQLSVPPMSTITQLQVNNQVGDVTVMSGSDVGVTTLKSVKTSSQDAANNEFKRLVVSVQASGTTLTVNGTVPDPGGLSSSSDSVNLTITLPGNLGGATPFKLNVGASVGDVTVTGINGTLVVTNDAGNITVKQAQLSDGSSLRTATGNVNFNGTLDTTTSSAPHYQLHSEVGNVDLTLPASTNVLLDANVNNGNFTSDFPLSIDNSAGSATFHGPLTQGATPTSTLTLDVGTGNITLHKS